MITDFTQNPFDEDYFWTDDASMHCENCNCKMRIWDMWCCKSKKCDNCWLIVNL